jgi:hypothetical protein
MRDAQLSEDDRDTLDRVRSSAAWQQAESERAAEREKRHAALVRERKALLLQHEKRAGDLNAAHLSALAEEEAAAAKLQEAKARRLEAERAAYGASFAAGHELGLIEADLRETADPAIEEARGWAREAVFEGNGGRRKQPGRRAVVDHRGLTADVPRIEPYRVALNFLGSMARTDAGPLYELEVEEHRASGKVAERIAELKAEGEALLAEGMRSEGPTGPLRRLVGVLRRVQDVHEARASARLGATPETAEAAV